MKVAVVGLKHLGWVTAACLAVKGHLVFNIDVEKECPEDEPELKDMIGIGRIKQRLFLNASTAFIESCDVVWITYDTPVINEKEIDIGHVIRRIENIMCLINTSIPIIISSQLPLGTIKTLEIQYPDHIFICIPENLRHGTAVNNFMKPDRIVVGIREHVHYEQIFPLLIGNKIETMSTEAAEMVKHAINAFLATEITFANELGDLCKKYKVSYSDVLRGLLTEERIGSKARLYAGAAYKGGTLARDINYLINLTQEDSIFNYVGKSNSHRLKKEKYE